MLILLLLLAYASITISIKSSPIVSKVKSLNRVTKPTRTTTSTSSPTSSRTLLIVESPSKASTIKKLLGPDYDVQSSLGHIRGITNSITNTDCDTSNFVYGIDINTFTPNYEITPNREKRVSELCSSIKDYNHILLASDNDREGESIAWHLASVLSLNTNECNRITFNEITKKALLDAVSTPRIIDMSLVRSQEARAIIDRILGFELTSLLVKHTGTNNVSAGRVMSVASKLILEKEYDINMFLSSQYYAVTGIFNGNTNTNYNIRFESKDDVKKLLNDLNSKTNSYVISATDKTVLERKPLIPFVLSSALKEVCRRFSVSSEKALMCLVSLLILSLLILSLLILSLLILSLLILSLLILILLIAKFV